MKAKLIFVILVFFSLAGCTGGNDIQFKLSLVTAERLSSELDLYVHVVSDNGTTSSSGNVLTKSNMALRVYTNDDINAYRTSYVSGSDEQEAFLDWLSGVLKDYTSEFPESEAMHYHGYTYAGFQPGAVIYADKMIWGREPGEDLSDKFIILRYPLSYDILPSYPDFRIQYGHDDNKPSTFKDLTSLPLALPVIGSCIATLHFSDIPDEDLDQITLYVEIPISTDYYEEYPTEMYNTHNLYPEGDRLLKGTVAIDFGSDKYPSLSVVQ